MAEIDSAQSQETVSNEAQNRPMNISFSIWPPTQRTRDAVINRLIESLSTPSILSKRYGTIPQDEASDIARQIEVDAFAAAGSTATDTDDGIEILQVYSKEISKRMIDTVKSRSAPAAGSEAEAKPSESPAEAKPSESPAEAKPSESPADAAEPSSASGLTGEVSSAETES